MKEGNGCGHKTRANRAVDNYRHFIQLNTKRKQALELEDYWEKTSKKYKKETGYALEFIRKEGASNGLSSVKYWIPPREFVISDNNWIDIKGYANTTKFKTENSEVLLERIVRHLTDKNDYVFDFFTGSATTQAVAQKLGCKWLGIEMAEHFDNVVLPRMKKVLSGHQSGISKNTDYRGGGAFKYYKLEQYEETLKNARYKDSEQLELDSGKSPFEQYVFFGDDKLAHAVKPKNNDGFEINLRALYSDIDIAESLSNILGKPIRRRTASTVTFTDGTTEKINPATMNEQEKQHFISQIRPYLWWGE